jgi:DNA-binding NarL/FixJ family response regulator
MVSACPLPGIFSISVTPGLSCCIGQGKSNAEISRELYMSVATVKAHVSRVLEKLKFNNRVQIALLAHDAGEA